MGEIYRILILGGWPPLLRGGKFSHKHEQLGSIPSPHIKKLGMLHTVTSGLHMHTHRCMLLYTCVHISSIYIHTYIHTVFILVSQLWKWRTVKFKWLLRHKASAQQSWDLGRSTPRLPQRRKEVPLLSQTTAWQRREPERSLEIPSVISGTRCIRKELWAQKKDIDMRFLCNFLFICSYVSSIHSCFQSGTWNPTQGLP